MNYKQSQYYKLRREWKEINSEYNEIKFIFDKIVIEFIKQVKIFCHKTDQRNPFDNEVSETQNVGGVELSSSFKKLYRKIMVNSHPDRVEDSEKTKKIYTQANTAKKEGNLQQLLDASKDLSIAPNLDELTMHEVDILKDNINEIKTKIKNIKFSYPWMWFHADLKKKKFIIIDFIEFNFAK